MTEKTSYAPGTPCWMDLSTPDVEAAERFYGPLFGWEIPELPNSAQMGGYRRAKLGGRDVAGVYPLMQEGQHPAWATYFSVEDAAATAAVITANGGSTIVEPMDIGMGHMAAFADPTGAVFGLWQPTAFHGAEVFGDPGTVCWNELGTRDVGSSRGFYQAVFGWGAEEQPMGESSTYTVWKLGEKAIGGMVDIAAIGLPAEVPPHWLVYFNVADADAAARQVEAGGGEIRNGPMDSPYGRLAVAADPFGAVFAAIEASEAPGA